MIGLPRGVEVFLFDQPCDMRRSFNTLAVVVQSAMKRDVTVGDLFVFVSKDRTRAKVLYHDGTGMCLFAKRMSPGQRFPAPWKMPSRPLSLSELALFIEGSAAARQALSPAVLRKADLAVVPQATESLYA